MLNFRETAEKAAAEFGLSMKDDPTLWPAGSAVTADDVRAACDATARDNARSALSRGLGKIAELIATEMDVAIAEDGPLADLDAVLAQHVTDAPEIDLSGVLEAKDWQDRVEALREAFGVAVQGYSVPPRPIIDIMHYVGTDPRLDGEVMRTVATLKGPEHDTAGLPAALALGGDLWDDGEAEAAPVARERGKPAPGRKRRTKAEIAEDAVPRQGDHVTVTMPVGLVRTGHIVQTGPATVAVDAARDWDDEPEEDAASWDDEPEAAPAVTADQPKLPALAAIAGIQDNDMAAVLGLSKSYYSLIRNGKRPWPGLKPDQVTRMAAELEARREAIAAIVDALTTEAVLRPEGV